MAIATGRPYFSIAEKFAPIIKQLYAISDNGGLVTYNNAELLSKPLPPHEIEALVTAARSVPNAWPQSFVEKTYGTWKIQTIYLLKKIRIYHKNFKIVDDLTEVEEVCS